MTMDMRSKLIQIYETLGMVMSGSVSISVLVGWIETTLGLFVLFLTAVWTYYKVKGVKLDNHVKRLEIKQMEIEND